jgi:cyanophycinase-like exopeptidase
MGGGLDVAVAFEWMIKQSGGGNFLVIRTDGTDAYNPWIYAMGGIQSVATIIMTSDAASSDPFVISQISNAEALWFAGGDQSTYINQWNNTEVQVAAQSLIKKGVPIGGTSAGMAVLPEFVYTAMTGESATSNESLMNPYNSDITLGDNFLSVPLLENVITDMHFVQRNRMGRSLTFVSRLMQDKWVPSGVNMRAVCADEQSAVMLDTQTGMGTITSPDGAFVYLLEATQPPSVCSPNIPLSIANVKVHRVESGDVFDFNNWQGVTGGIDYVLTVTNGTISSSNGHIY